jgi:hypothetical protein
MWNDKNTQCVLVGAAALLIAGATAAQVNEEVNSRPDPYLMDQDFFKMPEGRKLGATVTLVPDPDGVSLWVYDRCGDWACVFTSTSRATSGLRMTKARMVSIRVAKGWGIRSTSSLRTVSC